MPSAALLLSLALQADTTAPAPRTPEERLRDVLAVAMARHRAADTMIDTYRARLRMRASVALSRRTWAQGTPLWEADIAATMQWQRPNELKLDIVGRRVQSRWGNEGGPGFVISRPWFVPRSFGDSIRTFFDSYPPEAALHPFSPEGPRAYRFALRDSLAITVPTLGRRVLYALDVVPMEKVGARIVGRLWVDRQTGDVARMVFRFLPPTRTQRKELPPVTRYIESLDCDLEYAIVDGQHWLPYRQTISAMVRPPIVKGIAIPADVVTRFDEYDVNAGPRVALTPGSYEKREFVRDTTTGASRATGTRMGLRYDMRRAPRDSLLAYREWDDSLTPMSTAETRRMNLEARGALAELVAQSPIGLTPPSDGFPAYDRLADIARFNRVQGLAPALGVRVPAFDAFTTLGAEARIGTGDWRPMGWARVQRDAPGGRLTVSAYRDLADVDPFSSGLTLGNSLRSLLSRQDEADYLLATGGMVLFERGLGRHTELALRARVEQQRSVGVGTRSWGAQLFGNQGGFFPPNPAIDDGTFALAGATVVHTSFRSRWSLSADVLHGAGRTGLRVWGDVAQQLPVLGGGTVRVKAGVTSDPDRPQLLFRAGGLQTVRGFAYGAARGQAMWTVMTDVALTRSWIRPVLFVDAGQAARLTDLTSAPLLVGGGVGLSFLEGMVRLDLSHALSRGGQGGLRFDVVFAAVR